MKHMPQVIAMMTPFPHSIDLDATLGKAVSVERIRVMD